MHLVFEMWIRASAGNRIKLSKQKKRHRDLPQLAYRLATCSDVNCLAIALPQLETLRVA